MMRKLMALVVAMAAISGSAFAGSDGTGFETGPCTIPDGAPVPGSGDVHTAGPAPYYPYVELDENGRAARDADGKVIPLVTPAQAAVNAAQEGDTVVLQPGTYRETLYVRTSGLRIRGADRSGVVFDGSPTPGEIGADVPQLERGIHVESVDRVVVENLTLHNYRRDGLLFWHVNGYWARYVTAYNMGLYGIYAFDSRCGQINDSFASGNADSGFYVGECYPCDAVIHDIISQENGLGYSGTNAGGGLVLRDSIWRNNALGIVPNSLDGEDRPPQRGITIARNIVENNNNKTAPGVSFSALFYGAGIVVAGGLGNDVYGNTVTDHMLAGIALTPLPDQNLWIPSGNTIWGNKVSHPTGAPGYERAVDLAQGATSGANNCWTLNEFSNSAPEMIEEIYSCGLPGTAPGGDPRVEAAFAEGVAEINGRNASPWQTWPAPTAPEAFIDMPFDDGAVDAWLPALF